MENKIRTLVVIDNLHTGGVATSLYNYLKHTQDIQTCDLLVFNEDSIDYEKLPSGTNVLKPQQILHILGMYQKEIEKESLLLALIRGILFVLARKINGVFARKFLWPFIKKVSGYDYCLAYAQDDGWKSLSKGCVDFVIKKVEARKKAVVIHCDYKNFGGYNQSQRSQYDQLSYIVCVSESCKNSFDECFPDLMSKTVVCENFTDIEDISNKAGNGFVYDTGKINFITVCRFTSVKGLDRALTAFGKLYKEGLSNFTWTIVGDGPEMENIKKQIDSEGLRALVILIGHKNNPYYYIKNASFFLLPSRHEAAPMVFGESIALDVPVLTTKTCSAKELVEDRGYGYVVENSEEGLYKGLKTIIKSKDGRSPKMINVRDVNCQALLQSKHIAELITA